MATGLGMTDLPLDAPQALALVEMVDGLTSGLDSDLDRGLQPDGTVPFSYFGAMPRAGQFIRRALAPSPALPAYQ